MNKAQLYILIMWAGYSSARLEVAVRLHSYSNPNSEDCDGGHCEGILGGMCDNEFEFCLRTVGTSSCLTPPITSNDITDDVFTFGTQELSILELSNPLVFTEISVSNELEVLITVTDTDTFSNDDVDEIIVPFDSRQRANGVFSSATSYAGLCRRASIVVSINITRLCPTPNTYGQFCDQTCIEQVGQTNCNYLGQPQCLGNFAAPDCITCIANYYPSSTCDVFCQPRNDVQGHYTCNPDPASAGFVGSVGFYTVVGLFGGTSILAFFIILFLLLCVCAQSKNCKLNCNCDKTFCNCTCPKIDCNDICSDCEKICSNFFKFICCGLKCDDVNAGILCIIVILGFIAAPAIIVAAVLLAVVLAPVGAVVVVGACLLYSIAHCCD